MTDALGRLLRQLRPKPEPTWRRRVHADLVAFVNDLEPYERDVVAGWSSTMKFLSPLVTVERVHAWLTNRGTGTCAICGIHAQDTKEGKLHLDHDHSTGLPRDLLCSSCNTKRVPAFEDALAGEVQRYLKHWRVVGVLRTSSTWREHGEQTLAQELAEASAAGDWLAVERIVAELEACRLAHTG
jgi:hypothetical protein